MTRIPFYASKHTAQAYMCANVESENPSAACGSACGASDPKPDSKPSACGSACGAGDN